MTGEQLPQTAQEDEHEEQRQRRWPRRTVLAGAAAATLGGGAVGTVQAAETNVELFIQPNPVPDGQRCIIRVKVCEESSWADVVFGSKPEVDVMMKIYGVDRVYTRENQTIYACRTFEWPIHTKQLPDERDRHHVLAGTVHDSAEDYIEVV